MMVEIQVKLMGVLKDKMPEDGRLELPDAGTIQDALDVLGIATETVHVFTLNGQLERDKSRRLSNADELTVLPPVGGG